MDPMGTESTKTKMKPLRVAIVLPPSHLAHFRPCQRWHRFRTEGSITAQRSGLDPLRDRQGAMDSCASEQVEAQQRIFAMRYMILIFSEGNPSLMLTLNEGNPSLMLILNEGNPLISSIVLH